MSACMDALNMTRNIESYIFTHLVIKKRLFMSYGKTIERKLIKIRKCRAKL